MHAVLYVCLPRFKVRTSLDARKKVCNYLEDQGFSQLIRFGGRCDYYGVGGRWSGRLSLLRLRHEQPKVFHRFWNRLDEMSSEEEADALFRKMFPGFRGKLPINRGSVGFEGEPDDAQIMDKPLFEQLRSGFSSDVDYSYEIDEPNVICTEDDEDFKWPNTAKKATDFWVVLIDYHH